MNNSDIIKLEAVGEFPFTFYIEKAVPMDEGDEMILEGIASTTNIDHDKERMSKEALNAMESAINKDGVPLRVEHQKDELAIIGKVYKAWLDERNNLHIRARLDKSHPVSPILYDSMKKGVKMGLSVGGIVKRAVKEFSESFGGMVKTFYDVALQEVSVTPRPANYDSWLVAKSIASDANDAKRFEGREDIRREFLFENSQLDYLGSFAKSVPDKAWRKVQSPEINKNENSMTDEKDEKTEETEKARVDSIEKGLKELTQLVTKGFNSIGNFLGKAMDGDAMDAVNPDKKKPEEEPVAEKAGMDNEAEDQAQPKKDKPKDESPTAKSEESSEDDDKTKKTEDTYELETVERSIKIFDGLNKRLAKMGKTSEETDEKKDTEKSETEDEKKDETTKTGANGTTDDEHDTEGEKPQSEKSQHHPIDLFVAAVTKAMEGIVDRMEKSGHRVLGFEKEFVQKSILNDPEVQAEIQKMMKTPGPKRSVAMGVPYMTQKDGSRIALIPGVQQSTVEKSKKPVGNFADLYKKEYSSLSTDEE